MLTIASLREWIELAQGIIWSRFTTYHMIHFQHDITSKKTKGITFIRNGQLRTKIVIDVSDLEQSSNLRYSFWDASLVPTGMLTENLFGWNSMWCGVTRRTLWMPTLK